MENESDKSEEAFRKKFREIAESCRDDGFNTLIVQVRPFCDALYESDYFPYSHILSGNQGDDPGYDALKIMCDICRELELDIHAWVNPYRVKTEETPKALSEDNPSGLCRCIETENCVILDPSDGEARKLIISGVREIVRNYDVDGIQFDDYFYPENIGDADSEAYEEYLEGAADEKRMSVEEWRKQNINLLIAQTYMAVHEEKDNVVFGISPQGNLGNNDTLYADVRSWCTVNGYVDYLCPQIYFSLDNPAMRFEDALDEWLELPRADGVKLYAGLAGYKAGSDSDEGTWLDRDDILAEEYKLCRDKGVGIMLFGYESLTNDNSKKEIKNLEKLFE